MGLLLWQSSNGAFILKLTHTTVVKATYLRGIDGKTPSAAGVQPQRNVSTKHDASVGNLQAKAADKSLRPREAPEGTDQSDYLRRLAEDLQIQNRMLQKGRGGGFDAVLVVGSDVYDKLQVLRALRPKINSAVFLTTNLDARLFHPDELSVTQNLIIISAFGLKLAKPYQRDIPPFRDSFQTAAFAGTLCALGEMAPNEIVSSTPRIYEVGLGGPVDLSEWVDLKAGRTDIHGDSETAKLESWSALGTWRSVVIAAPFLLAIAGAGMLSGWKALYANRIAVLSAAILAMLLFLRMVPQNVHAGEEPFALLSGISIWPAEALRLLAFILSLHFVGRAINRLKQNDLALAEEFELGPESSLTSASRNRNSVSSRIESWLKSILMLKPSDQVAVRQLWADYCYASTTRHRLIVSSVFLLVYLVFVVALVKAVGAESPLVPARGEQSFKID